MDALKTCCRQPYGSHICGCRFTHPDALRDCRRCPKTAPWEHCAHWAFQYPEARLLRTETLVAGKLVAGPFSP